MRRPKCRAIAVVWARFTRRVARRHEWDKAAEWDWWDPTITGLVFVGPMAFLAYIILTFRFDDASVRWFIVPLGALAVVIGVPNIAAHLYLGLRRRRRNLIAARIRGRRCSHCGYARTGNVSGVCPECGTPLPRRIGRPRRQRSAP